MKSLSRLFLFMLIVAGSYYFFQGSDFTVRNTFDGIEEIVLQYKENIDQQEFIAEHQEKAVHNTEKKEANYSPEKETGSAQMGSGLAELIGKGTDKLMEVFGEPVRKDPSSYGYESWVYTDQSNEYIQVAVLEGKIQMIFAAGENLSIQPSAIGQSYDKIKEHYNLKNELSLNFEGARYRFQLSSEDMAMRPIVKLNETTFLQFYFDTFEDQLSSVRYVTSEVLLAHRPYEVYYRSGLPELPDYNTQKWEEIQTGMEKQVYELTNVLRNQYGSELLKWNAQAAEVAYGHSKDMYENSYFSHFSLDGRGLKERLNEYEIDYFSAGENIAAQYTDGPAAVEGWLNSKGHREALLNNQYTHLGVGVYRYYYTQNFLQKS